MQGTRDRETKPLGPAVVLAILFAVLMVSALVLRFWATEQEHVITGPTHVTAGAQGVFFSVAEDIVHVSRDGALLAVLGREQTGLDDIPIDLRLLENGELLVASQRPAEIRLCTPEPWTCRRTHWPAISTLERQYKVLSDGDAWLLTDALGDTLWRLDGPGTGLSIALPARTLAGPNGLARGADGRVWVADTDHRRIVELLPLGDGTFVTGREHSAMNELTISDRHYPMTLEAAPDGSLWVVQATDFSRALADLVRYDPDEGAVQVVPLGAGAYPTDLAVLDGYLLVTDMERFTIGRVDTASLDVDTFGGPGLAAYLQDLRADRDRFALLGTVSLIALIVAAVSMIFAALKATPKERRWSHPPAFDPENAPDSVPETKVVHWLETNSNVRWMANWLDRIYYILFGLLCLCSLLIYTWACRQPWWPEGAGISPSGQLGIVLLLTCLVVASFIPMMHQSARVLRRRIGSDGRYVHFELEDGRRIRVAPAELCWNRRAVLFRGHTFPLHSGRKYSLYAAGEIETWLAPMLREATRLGEWQTMRYQWRHRDPLLLSVAGAFGFMLIVLVAIELFFGH